MFTKLAPQSKRADSHEQTAPSGVERRQDFIGAAPIGDPFCSDRRGSFGSLKSRLAATGTPLPDIAGDDPRKAAIDEPLVGGDKQQQNKEHVHRRTGHMDPIT